MAVVTRSRQPPVCEGQAWGVLVPPLTTTTTTTAATAAAAADGDEPPSPQSEVRNEETKEGEEEASLVSQEPDQDKDGKMDFADLV